MTNLEAIQQRVGEQRNVCGIWKCQPCKAAKRPGIIYYEVYESGEARCRCTDPNCEHYSDVPMKEWSRAKNP